MMKRRDFIQSVAAAGLMANLPRSVFAQPAKERKEGFIWANLLHLSYNMWEDHTPPPYQDTFFFGNDCREAYLWAHKYHPDLTFDKKVWDRLLIKMADVGMNMVIIDLGDGIKYDSHPEIAVNGAWSPSQLKKELKTIRELGLEPIPKLNFSTGHKAWLGPYQRMISSDTYYKVCSNLIHEVIDLFDKPRFFHLGMDEETAENQRTHQNVVVRQGDLWWHDFYFLTEQVEKQNVRSWIWSDYVWSFPDEFFKKMPKSVLQSNWYYGSQFEKFDNPLHEKYVRIYDRLEEHGFDQVPTGSNHSNDINFRETVTYCEKKIAPERLKGFMQTVWRPTLPVCQQKHIDAIDQVAEVIRDRSRNRKTQ
jgi:hypothetical protein